MAFKICQHFKAFCAITSTVMPLFTRSRQRPIFWHHPTPLMAHVLAPSYTSNSIVAAKCIIALRVTHRAHAGSLPELVHRRVLVCRTPYAATADYILHDSAATGQLSEHTSQTVFTAFKHLQRMTVR